MSVNQPVVHVFDGEQTHDGLPVVIGVPFPKGQLKEPGDLFISGPSGSSRPIAARSLVTWPDGTTRWALCAFLAAEKGHHIINTSGPQISTAAQPVRCIQKDNDITLDNGHVQVTLSAAGAGPIAQLTALGHAYIKQPQDFRLVVDNADSTNEQRRSIRVLEQSPLRVRVRIEGAHLDRSGKRKLNYHLDVELWAGWPTLRLDYRFFNLEPGQDELPIDRISVECKLALGERTERHLLQKVHGLLYVPREVNNPAPVALVADQTRGSTHVEDPVMLLDTVKYNFHLRPPLVDTADWLGVSDSQRSAYVRMQDFAAMRPKRLASDGATISLDVWPKFAGKLALPQGRSRRQVITMTFADEPKLPPSTIERQLDAPFWEGRAVPAPQWLARCGEFEQDRIFSPGGNVRFEKALRRLVAVNTPQSMFDLGDTPDSGYLRTYIPIGNAQARKAGAPEMGLTFLAAAHNTVPTWAFPEFYEPVWTNNEYDLIHALAQELMRTGRSDHWQMLRWAVRHNIEVDFVHYSDHKQQHRATPQHSARHNRSGAILSHFWTQGLLEYYCMTGDVDVLEVAMALGDKIIEDLTVPETRESFWGFTRELGWPTLALSYLAEITGEQRYQKQLKEIIDFFVGYDRRKFHGPLKLSSGDARYSLERQMVSGFFAYASMMEGVDHYIRGTGDKTAEAWLIQMLDDIRVAIDEANKEGQPFWIGHMLTQAMAIGYEHTGDERYLRSGMLLLEEFADNPSWSSSSGETKTTAMMHRALVRFLHHVQRTGMLNSLDYNNLPRL